jgi:hypothetical protein
MIHASAKWLTIPIVAGIGWAANDYLEKSHTNPTATWSPFTSSSQTLGPPADREFQVQSGYTTPSGLMLLNDRPDYRDPASFTAVIDTKRVTTAGQDGRALIGKTVHVKGRQANYRGKAQIVADAVTVK